MKVDVVVIGAGITGAGIAQAAAAAGLSVAVLEQGEPGCGTSSQSSKLIHGGLRYLESFQFNLVRECLTERQLLLQLAPELVKMQAFHIPIYHQASRAPWKIHLGLWLYKQLAGNNSPGFERLSKQHWQDLDSISTHNLKAVYRYYDAQTDDAALTHAVLNSAIELGAQLLCPITISGISLGSPKAQVFLTNGDTIQASLIFNCTGPWCNSLLNTVTPTQTDIKYELIQGSHLLLPNILNNYYYLEAPQDRRAVFATPWQDGLLLGTTETPYKGDPSKVNVLDTEQEYLLQVVHHYFPHLKGTLCAEQIKRTFCGLRVLAPSKNSAFKRRRDCIIQADNQQHPQLISVIGGKLTSYRAVAEQLIQDSLALLPARKKRANTYEIRLNP